MIPILAISILNAVFIPQEARVNEVIDELRVRGVPVVRFANTMPYKVREVVEGREKEGETGHGEIVSEILLGRLDYLEISTPQVRFYVNGLGMSDTVTRYFQDARLVISVPMLDICIQPFIKFGKSDEYPTLLWRDIVGGDLKRAYGSMEFDRINILLGRESLRWGPLPQHSLMLSGISPAFDLLYASYEYDFVKGSFFCTSLDPYTVGDSLINRFFSGHRLDFSLFNDKLLLGLSEVVIYSGEDLNFHPYYLNPFTLFFWAYTHNRNRENLVDNIGWGLDFSYYVKNGLCFYGELLMDDAQYEKTEGNIPNMLAYRIGLKGARGKNFWTLQYTRVDTWTYIHRFYWNNFLFLDYPIGHPKGQDFYEIYGKLVHHLNYHWDITFAFCYARNGENSFDNLWPSVFPKHQKFPSGVVERSRSIEAGLRFFNLPRLSVEIVAGYTWIGNYRNVFNKTECFPSLRLKFSSRML